MGNGLWADDEHVAGLSGRSERREQRNRSDGLPEPHLVSQQTAAALRELAEEPLQSRRPMSEKLSHGPRVGARLHVCMGGCACSLACACVCDHA